MFTTVRSSSGPLKWTVAVFPSSLSESTQTETPLYFMSMSVGEDKICFNRFTSISE